MTTPGEAITTYAVSGFKSTLLRASRRRRFALLRDTAPPTRREATIPTWGAPLSPQARITRMSPCRADRPVRKTAENRAGDRSETNGRPVLCRETMATLETPSLDQGAARTGPHPGAKSMLALAAPHVWLIGALHSEVSPLGRSRYDREEFGRLNPTSLGVLTVGSSPERELPHRSAKSRAWPRNIVRTHSDRSRAHIDSFPYFSILWSPYAARVLFASPSSSLPDTERFPLLAAPFSRDI